MSNPVKILHVLGSMNRGGQETFVMNVYRNINKKKYQFDFLIFDKNKCDYEDEIIHLGGKINRIHINYNDGKFKRVGKRVIDTVKFLKLHKEYNCIHIHTNSVTCLIDVLVAKIVGVKTIIVHSHNTQGKKLIGNELLKNILWKNCTAVWACSKEAGEWLFPMLAQNEVKVIKNAIDSENFKFNSKCRDTVRNELEIANKLVIGHVGRFNFQKNHKFLIDIFKEVHSKRCDTHLLLIGQGELKEQIERKVRELKIEESVSFLGVREDINELLQAIDIFLFPSHFEGLPVSLIEAQAAGVKIIAADNMSKEVEITDLIKFVPIKDGVKKWAEEILSCKITRKDQSGSIIKAGYDMKTNTSMIEIEYSKLIQVGAENE